jgi:hypothetical protein
LDVKAAESNLNFGKLHGSSISFYETGERFRTAIYDSGLLVSEAFLFKEGDTIRSFPVIRDDKVHTISITDNKRHRRLAFDLYDGKIIQGTYEAWDMK